MARVPGANAPLGQGIPGGAGSLPSGLPLPGGGSTGLIGGAIAPPPIPKSALGAASPPLPTVVNTGTAAGARQTGGGLQTIRDQQNLRPNSASTRSITEALGVLSQVEKGKLKPDKAAKMMQGLTPGDQGKLADLIAGHFARTGTVDRNVLKSLQTLQTLPAPDDAQPHDLVTNFAHDTSDLITGLPAGIGLAATYLGKDIVNPLIPGNKPTSHFYDKIVAPVAKSYAKTYGPALHGDFGKTLHAFHEHPLAPVLDAASLFSAGAGTVGRLGRAGEAISAARTGALADAAKIGTDLVPKRMIPLTKGLKGKFSVSSATDSQELFHASTEPGWSPTSADLMNFIADNVHHGDKALTLRDEHGAIQAAVSYDDTGDIVKGYGAASRTPGAGIKVMQALADEVAKSGKPIQFQADPQAIKYYDRLGLRKVQEADSEGYGTTYELNPDEAKTFAKSDILVPSRQMVVKASTKDFPMDHNYNAVTQEFDHDPLHAAVTNLAKDPKFAGEANKVLQEGPHWLWDDVHTQDPNEVLNHADSLTGNDVRNSILSRTKDSPFMGALLKEFDKQTGIDPGTGLSKVQLAKAGIKGFTQGGPKGNLIDLYDAKRGITHEAEIQNYMKEIGDVFKNSDKLQVGRRGMKQVVSDVATDIRATRAQGKARPGEMAAKLPGFISAGSTGRALSTGETALREASDMVRAGAIYLRPAYLPNNWAGNSFMTAVHQGAWAPLNLAKSLVINKHMDSVNLAAMRKSMGANPAEVVTSGTGRGYVSSLTHPIAHVMGTVADQPFRDAAFLHEARRAGYNTLKSVDDLFNKSRMSREAGAEGATAEGDAALREIANISRKAQEEIVKFGHMNETERSVIRNLVFVYSWMRGAGRYAGRFPLAHPIQTNAFRNLSGPGNQYIRSVMGGTPSFLAGSVPVGRDKNGNPILVNPFSLNPLGTGLQIAQAAAGTLDVIRDPKSFNKYAQNDIFGLTNPLVNSYITARSGGQPVKKQLENTIAALALKRGLQHPGSGSIYPTSRAEAIGHFAIGSLYPRVGDQTAITKALERQDIGHPAALIPQQIKDFKKATGQDIPPQLVSAYQGDLEAIQMQKDFQQHYADSHGSSGFRNMPPQNKVEAALAYLAQHSHIPPQQIAQLKQGATQLTTDQEFSDYSNALWSMTGAGEYRRAWLDLMRSSKGSTLTRKH